MGLPIFQPGAVVPRAPGRSTPTGPSRRGSHRLAALSRCGKQWLLRYYLNLVPRVGLDKPARMRGTLWHLCAAYYEAWRMPPDQRPAWYERPLYDALREVGVGHEAMVEHLYHKVLPRYYDWSQRRYAASGLVPYAIEEEFSARVGDLDPGGPDTTLDDEIVTCAPDLVLTDGTYLCVDDYKTKARSYRKDGKLSTFKTLANEHRPSMQAMQNLAVLRAARPEFITRVFSVVRVLVVDPYDMDRHEILIPEVPYSQLGRIIRNRVRRERELTLELDRRLAAGDNLLHGGPDDAGDVLENYDACQWGKYGACDYVDICTAPDDEARQRAVSREFVSRIVSKDKEYEDDDESTAP